MINRGLLVNAATDLGREVADLVDRLAAQGGLQHAQAYRLRLAADEITTNIAGHGYQGRVGRIDLAGGVTDDRVWLSIEDDAAPFDPLGHHPDPRLSAEPAGREIGGLGLHLALTVVDEFSYERSRGRNRNVLVIRRGDHGCRAARHDGGAR